MSVFKQPQLSLNTYVHTRCLPLLVLSPTQLEQKPAFILNSIHRQHYTSILDDIVEPHGQRHRS